MATPHHVPLISLSSSHSWFIVIIKMNTDYYSLLYAVCTCEWFFIVGRCCHARNSHSAQLLSLSYCVCGPCKMNIHKVGRRQRQRRRRRRRKADNFTIIVSHFVKIEIKYTQMKMYLSVQCKTIWAIPFAGIRRHIRRNNHIAQLDLLHHLFVLSLRLCVCGDATRCFISFPTIKFYYTSSFLHCQHRIAHSPLHCGTHNIIRTSWRNRNRQINSMIQCIYTRSKHTHRNDDS